MRDNYDVLKTEGRNPRTMDIDKLSSLEMDEKEKKRRIDIWNIQK